MPAFYYPKKLQYEVFSELKYSDSIKKNGIVWDEYKKYVICVTARTGSTALCSLLKKTGSIGRPGEYFNYRGPFKKSVELLSPKNFHDYFEKLLQHRTSNNKVFGLKTNFWDFAPFIEKKAVDTFFNDAKYIYLIRRDLVLQAISLYMASQTKVWHGKKGSESSSFEDMEINEKIIENMISHLSIERANWEAFFSIFEIKPLIIYYEDMIQSFPHTLSTIANYLSISIENTASYEPEFHKIGTEKNIKWARQIRQKYRHGKGLSE